MLDETTQRLIIDDKIINLGEIQTRVLFYLICNKHRRVSSEELAEYVYKYGKPKNPRCSLAAVIFNLVRKTNHRLTFRTMSKVGYRIGWVEND